MKIKIIIFYAISILFFGLLGCQNHATDKTQIITNNSITKAQIKLKWLGHWFGEGKKETLLREVARDFCLLNQNIEIDLEFPYQMANIKPTDATYLYTIDTIIKMVRQNKWPYDLMLCDAFLYSAVADSLNNPNWGKDYLVNFIDQPWLKASHKNMFFETNKHTDNYGAIAPGAYIEGVWNLLYVSSEIENRLGIKVKTLDMNLSDFITYAKAVYQYNQNHIDKITFFSTPHEHGTRPFFNQIVMSALEKDSANNRQEAINALRQAYLAIEKLAPYKPLESNLVYDNERTLYHDKILFISYPSWINLLWQKSNPTGAKLMHPCEFPSIENKKASFYSGLYSAIFVVPKNAKNRKEAELFMQFISSQETAEKWIRYSKCPTGLKSQISYSDFGTDEYTLFSQHISRKYQDKLDEVNLATLLFHSNKSIDFQVAKVMNGQITGDEAIKNILKQIGIK